MTPADWVLYGGGMVLIVQLASAAVYVRIISQLKHEVVWLMVLGALILSAVRQVAVLLVAVISQVGGDKAFATVVLIASLTLLPLVEGVLLFGVAVVALRALKS